MAAGSDWVKLKAEIETAFADVLYYKEDTFAANAESLAAMSRFKGHSWLDWKDKPLELLPDTGSELPFFSSKALRCYLPLYMLAALVDYKQARPFLSGLVELFVLGSISQEQEVIVRDRLWVLTGWQLQSLADFLDFIRKEHGKDLSLYCPLDKAIETVRYEADRYSRLNASGLAATKLKAEIEAAFAAVPYPGDADDALVEHICPECLETAARFRGLKWQNWKDKPLELFSRGREHLLRFTPTAFHYYLPLYMVQSLVDYLHADIAIDEIISIWTPSPEMTEHSQKRCQLMSAREIQAVISFLEFLKEKHGDNFPSSIMDEAIKNARNYSKAF